MQRHIDPVLPISTPMETSSLITIVYFTSSISLLFILALWVYHSGQHFEAKSFGTDVWAQRKIYAPIIVHFYDTATDIGVVWYFYELMVDEQNGNYDYKSLDMEVMFWLGLSFLMLHRVLMFGLLIYFLVRDGPDENIAWYDPILVLLELYVFRTVYLSYRDAKDKIKENVQKRQKRLKVAANFAHASSQPEAGSTTITSADLDAGAVTDVHAVANLDPTDVASASDAEPQADSPKIQVRVSEEQSKEMRETASPSLSPSADVVIDQIMKMIGEDKEIELCRYQQLALLIESITESLPQIMLQSVFIIRSYNDPDLRDSEIELLMLSVMASLFSISDKFCKIDEAMGVDPKFKSAKFRSFDKGLCFNLQSLGYTTRVFWRMSTITSNFVVYVLIWTVIGGTFLPIYVLISFILYALMGDEADIMELMLTSVVCMGSIFPDCHQRTHFAKWCLVSISLLLIAMFATAHFDCLVCAKSKQRHFDNEDETGVRNYRILVFYVLGWMALMMEIPLYFISKKKGVFKE